MFHPDKNHGNAAAEARMKDINGAWEVLGDDEKRKSYDAWWSRKAEEQAARQRAQAQQQQSGPVASTGTNEAEWWRKNWGWVVAGFAIVVLVVLAIWSASGNKAKPQYA